MPVVLSYYYNEERDEGREPGRITGIKKEALHEKVGEPHSGHRRVFSLYKLQHVCVRLFASHTEV